MEQNLPKYTTIYIPSKQAKEMKLESIPKVGVQCPNPDCGGGFIESGKWDSVICTTCRYAYKKSKYEDGGTPKKEPETGLEPRIKALEERTDNIVKVLDILRGKK